jgi:hypothetical protein
MSTQLVLELQNRAKYVLFVFWVFFLMFIAKNLFSCEN